MKIFTKKPVDIEGMKVDYRLFEKARENLDCRLFWRKFLERNFDLLTTSKIKTNFYKKSAKSLVLFINLKASMFRISKIILKRMLRTKSLEILSTINISQILMFMQDFLCLNLKH